jgi:hypothetical protein
MQDTGIDKRIILNWIIKKMGERMWTGFIQFWTGTIVGSCEHSKEHSSSKRGWKFLYYLNNHWLLKKDSAENVLVRYAI